MRTPRYSLAAASLITMFVSELESRAQRVGPTPQPPGIPVAPEEETPTPETWAIHGQTTFVEQWHPPFNSPYMGPNSLNSGSRSAETWDATLYAGFRPWRGAEIWINPEIDQGFGLSNTLGVAGFPSAEAYKVGERSPYYKMPRGFFRQTINLGGEVKKLEPDLNQLGGSQTADRIVLTIGKFSVVDVFDTNQYAHDPRNDFLNWSIVEMGTFDYAADAWGFTYGLAAEWYQDWWTVRMGLFDGSLTPNSTKLDPVFISQFQYVVELEERHQLWSEPGKLKLLAFLTRARLGRYADATAISSATGEPADIAGVRDYRSRVGVGLNLEQALSDDLGLFARTGWSKGTIETYDFTDINATGSIGLSLKGSKWGRPNDTAGLGVAINAISSSAKAFFNAGGLGILVGDGKLPKPGTEQILEAYYSLAVFSFAHVTADYQFINHPAYNLDRGPVSVFGVRLHAQF
ncbi:MAG: carbohydrate porin [Acetobacteraceae bacterium]|nr:carbohydrate porin [Acetobacteraceae bacterium]